MKSISLLIVITAALLVCGCATPVARDLNFNETSPTALLVVSSPAQSMATITEFRRVNLETQSFEDEIVDIVTAGLGVSHVINYSNASVWLSMREVPPGDYALVSLTVNTFNGYASGQQWICIYGGVPVYRLEPGQITVVSTWDWWGALNTAGRGEPRPEAVLAEFERARARYPEIVGAASMPPPQGEAYWPETRPNFMQSINRNCAEPDTFTVMPIAASAAPAVGAKP